jgi:hypothetical protein
MNRHEFQRLALVYGATIGRWPAQHQGAARRLLEQEPGLSRVLDGASELDAALEMQREPISDLRLSQLKARMRALTLPAPSSWGQVWQSLVAFDLSAIAVGAVSALCIAWAVQSQRPPSNAAASATGQQSLLTAILDLDSMSIAEVADGH